MPRVQRKSIEFPAEVRAQPLTSVEIFEPDDIVIGRMRMEPGWRWSTHVRPPAGADRCQYHHLGVCTAGSNPLAAAISGSARGA